MTDNRLAKRIFLVLTVLLVLGQLPGPIQGQTTPPTIQTIPVKQWLAAGPWPLRPPAYGDGKARLSGLSDLLSFEAVDVPSLAPKNGSRLLWTGGTEIAWKEIASGEKGVEFSTQNRSPEVAYLAAVIEARRWTRARLSLSSPQLFQAYLDGKMIAAKTKAGKPDSKNVPPDGATLADLKLETGNHLLVIKTLFDPAAGAAWTFSAALELGDRFGPEALSVTTAPDDRMSIKRLLDGPKPAALSLSPDGVYAALSVRQSLPPSDDSETWVEIYRLDNFQLVRTLRCSGLNSSINWVGGGGHKFSYTAREKAGGTIWLGDMEDGSLKPLLSKVTGLGAHTWAPDGGSFIYDVSEEPDRDPEGVKRFRGLADRQPNWRSQSYLYRYNLGGGDRRRLTAGDLATALNGISPDGTKLLVGRTLIDYKVRPYSQTELSVLDLETGQSVIVWTGSWLTDAQWAPDGKSLLLLGGPSLFGDKGAKVAKGIMPNEYDIEAYLFDLQTKRVEPLTRDFDPSVDQAYWSAPKDVIYFLTTDRAGRRLYRCRLADKAFQQIPAGTEVIEQLSVARTKAAAAFIGSEPNLPPKAYVLDLESAAVRLLSDPGAGDAAAPKFGRVEPWTFRNKRGVVIDGLVYYPRDFDPAKKYPCIVNYYGGTTPITSQFGGRYPKELYAAQGCAVYVLQPSGAIGYGQNFSALHVNDWGMIVADEIIDGVKKFLAEHPWVDSRRVGCIGASYGGFMTELILTRTNLFAAAISHAGISSIAGYWGEGFWGYSYSAVATANSFPWNRPDIYINQSPLYSANKITTPLLLLHGASDTNVPPGESAQMYTALKLLGREVEFVQIQDQDHLILTYNKRIVWLKTILAWFDKWLKRQPEWWSDLYPQK